MIEIYDDVFLVYLIRKERFPVGKNEISVGSFT